jgi:hypothetical protein
MNMTDEFEEMPIKPIVNACYRARECASHSLNILAVLRIVPLTGALTFTISALARARIQTNLF